MEKMLLFHRNIVILHYFTLSQITWKHEPIHKRNIASAYHTNLEQMSHVTKRL